MVKLLYLVLGFLSCYCFVLCVSHVPSDTPARTSGNGSELETVMTTVEVPTTLPGNHPIFVFLISRIISQWLCESDRTGGEYRFCVDFVFSK